MNKKKSIIVIFLVIVLAVAYYLISPLWRVIEVQDETPLVESEIEIQISEPEINDQIEKMEKDVREEFEKEMVVAKKITMIKKEEMPPTVKLLAQGVFKEDAHEVMGNAKLIQNGDSNILRFEDFETVNGPNLHIYLASSLDATDFIDLGEIRATKGNVNYTIPDGADLEKYNKALVWCVPFKVLFSHAELK